MAGQYLYLDGQEPQHGDRVRCECACGDLIVGAEYEVVGKDYRYLTVEGPGTDRGRLWSTHWFRLLERRVAPVTPKPSHFSASGPSPWNARDIKEIVAQAASEATAATGVTMDAYARTFNLKPSEPLFYVQNVNAGYVGNNPVFWAKGGNGYTSYIDNAERFTEADARKLVMSDRRKWRAWAVELIEPAIYRTVESQKLDCNAYTPM